MTRVTNAYEICSTNSRLSEGENPIAKVPLIVGNDSGVLNLEPFYTEDHLTLNEAGVPRRIYKEDKTLIFVLEGIP